MWCAAKCCVLYHTAGKIVTFSTTSVTSVCTGDTFSSRRRLGHCCAGWFFDTLKKAASWETAFCTIYSNSDLAKILERFIGITLRAVRWAVRSRMHISDDRKGRPYRKTANSDLSNSLPNYHHTCHPERRRSLSRRIYAFSAIFADIRCQDPSIPLRFTRDDGIV